MDIGARIKELRTLAGLEAKDLANKMGVSPSCVSLYESNKRPCSLERIIEICDALGIGLEDFFNTEAKQVRDAEFIKLAEEIKVNKELGKLVDYARRMKKETLNLVIALCENMR